MTLVKLTNNFHNTEARFRPVPLPLGRHWVSLATARRLRRTLCGASGCVCGGEFGQRGDHQIDLIADSPDGYVISLD